MKQRGWVKLLKDYDCTIEYHPGKANTVADALSRKSNSSLSSLQVKTEHQAPTGKLHPLSISEWKWERITMDFVMGLPMNQKGNDAIWVIVDHLTKSAHFLPIRWSCTLDYPAKRYVNEIVRLHMVKLTVNQKGQSKHWKFHSSIGMALYEALYGRKCRSPLYWDK
ncbi:uncharacterized protein LOC141665504 [Apium graveolens]|uniref:uncharacterized protein LOC141665504 n=1 Tax=Apium graveolens TaxID=4045 RepID=UPI003D7B7B2C